MSDTIPQVFLSRRNLLTLLAKLDRAACGDLTERTIIKRDVANSKYPQTHDCIIVTGVEDKEYYSTRSPGPVHPLDVPN